MQIFAGTSGYSYKEWRGSFYPEGLSEKRMLAYYAERLDTVEINNTFYRMPTPRLLDRWAAEVPERFVFALKASRKITHIARLKDTTDALRFLWESASRLGARLGPILFQLPPYLRKDIDRLRAFLAELPDGMRAAVEFRHDSWEDAEVRAALADAGAALCVADAGEGEDPPLHATADWGYLRLRRAGYTDGELARWAERVRAQPFKEVFVFFKHEDEGAAPRLAGRFSTLCGRDG